MNYIDLVLELFRLRLGRGGENKMSCLTHENDLKTTYVYTWKIDLFELTVITFHSS